MILADWSVEFHYYLHFTYYYTEPGCWINGHKLYCLLSRKLNEIQLQLFAWNIEGACSVSIYKLEMYILSLLRCLYFIQTVEQAASPATKEMKPE